MHTLKKLGVDVLLFPVLTVRKLTLRESRKLISSQTPFGHCLGLRSASILPSEMQPGAWHAVETQRIFF